MFTLRGVCVTALLMGFTAALPAAHIDTFSDGTTMGWFVPDATHPTPPVVEATGGPAGAGDAYLVLTALGGRGPGSRLSVLNESQWARNYLAGGITEIQMDVRNFGPDDVYLRLLFEDFDPSIPGPPVNLALTSNAVFVPGGSDWTRVSFAIAPADLTALIGAAEGALNTDVLRIFHNPDPEFPGPGVGIPTVIAQIGVDNITAIPEPGSLWLLSAGVGLLFLARRRTLV